MTDVDLPTRLPVPPDVPPGTMVIDDGEWCRNAMIVYGGLSLAGLLLELLAAQPPTTDPEEELAFIDCHEIAVPALMIVRGRSLQAALRQRLAELAEGGQ